LACYIQGDFGEPFESAFCLIAGLSNLSFCGQRFCVRGQTCRANGRLLGRDEQEPFSFERRMFRRPLQGSILQTDNLAKTKTAFFLHRRIREIPSKLFHNRCIYERFTTSQRPRQFCASSFQRYRLGVHSFPRF